MTSEFIEVVGDVDIATIACHQLQHVERYRSDVKVNLAPAFLTFDTIWLVASTCNFEGFEVRKF